MREIGCEPNRSCADGGRKSRDKRSPSGEKTENGTERFAQVDIFPACFGKHRSQFSIRQVTRERQDRPFAVLGIWVVGAVLAFAGALSYGELGAMFPEAGGECGYLRDAFGPIFGLLTVAKATAIVVLIIAGFLLGRGDWGNFHSGAAGILPEGVFRNGSVSLIFVLFSFSGWNAAAYIAGEVREPHRTLPASLITGTAIVTAIYLGLNMLFVYAL